MVSKLFNHPAAPILAVSLLLQMMLWQAGASFNEAAAFVTVLAVVSPLVSRRIRAEYRHAFRMG